MKEQHHRHKQQQQQHHNHHQQQQQQRRRLQHLPQQQHKRCSEIFKNIKIHKNRKDILTFLKANYKYKRRCRSSVYVLPVRHRMWCTKHGCEEELQTKSDNDKMYFSLINLSSVVVLFVANLIDRRLAAAVAATTSDDKDGGADGAAAAAPDMPAVDGVDNDDVNDDSDETSCQRNYDKLSTLVHQTHQRKPQQHHKLHQQQQQQQQQQQYQQQHQQHRRQQQQHSLRRPQVWLRRLSNELSQQQTIYGPRRRRRQRGRTSAIGASRISSQQSDGRTQVMPIFMTLFIALALSGRCVEGGACWQKTLSSSKCNEIFSLNITKVECCSTNQGFSYTDRDLSSVEYFFATTIGGGMECAPCLESCKNVRCGLNKKCAKRKGRPKCICAPECGAATRTQRRTKIFRGEQYQQQPHHPNHHQKQHQQLHKQPHHTASSQLKHHSRQRHLETAVIFGKSARDIRSLSSETQSQNIELEDAVAVRRMSATAVGVSNQHSSSQRKLISVVQSQARVQSKRDPKLIIVEPQKAEEAAESKTTTRRLQVISNVNNNNNNHHNHRNSNNSNSNNKKRKKNEKERVHKQDQSIRIRTLHKNKKKQTTTTTMTTMTMMEENGKDDGKRRKKKRKEEAMMTEMDTVSVGVGENRRGSVTTIQPSSRRKPNTNNNNNNNSHSNKNNNSNNSNNDGDDLQQTTNFEANNTKLRHIHSNARQRVQDAPHRDQQQQEQPHQKQQQQHGHHHPLRKRKKKLHNKLKDQNADTTTTLTVMSGSELATEVATTTATSRRRQQSSMTTTTTKLSSTPSAHSSVSEDQPRLLNRGSSFATSSLPISAASSGSTAAAAFATSSVAAAAAAKTSSSSSVTTIALLTETEASSTSSASPSPSLSAARSSVLWSPSFPSSATAVAIADINGNSNTGNTSNNNRSLINSSDDLAFDDRIYEKFNLHGFPSQQYKFTQLERIHHSSHHHHHPVCGTDGRTYNTECQLKKRACRTDNPDLVVAYRGHCKTTCNGVKCLNGLTCVEDHYTIPHCIACRIDCPLDDANVDGDGDGRQVNNNNADDEAVEIDASRAVCGVDGKTYRSVCDINRMICKIGRSIGVAYPGPCRDDRVSCSDISCGPKRTCLVDLLTHEPRCVSCRYKCARKRRPVSLRYEEGKICGANKRTYNSWCEMRKDSCATGFFIDVKSLGECQK